MRLRIRFTDWPRPALELTDTPRPTCPNCKGTGTWTGTRIQTDCGCYNPARAWFLAPVPRRWAR